MFHLFEPDYNSFSVLKLQYEKKRTRWPGDEISFLEPKKSM